MNEYTMSVEKWFGGTIEFTQAAENRADAMKKAAYNEVCLRRYYDIKPGTIRVLKKNKRKTGE